METIEFDAVLEKAKAAFCEGVFTDATTFLIDGEERRWTWVLDQLEDCWDELPDHVGDLLDCDTYARGVKDWWNGMGFKAHFLSNLMREPDLPPEVRAGVQRELDFVYRVTGWERPVADHG